MMDIDNLRDLMGRATPGPMGKIDVDGWNIDAPGPAQWVHIGRKRTKTPVVIVVQDARRGGFLDEQMDADAELYAMSPDLAAEILRLTAELESAMTDLGKVIMALPHGSGMRIEGAVEGVRMLRAERDALVAANQVMVERENEARRCVNMWVAAFKTGRNEPLVLALELTPQAFLAGDA